MAIGTGKSVRLLNMDHMLIYFTLLQGVFHLGLVTAVDLPMLMIEEGLVPDILSNPPNATCEVVYEESGLHVSAGDLLSPFLLQEEPAVMWNVSSDDVLHTLVVVGMSQHNHTEYRSKPYPYTVSKPIVEQWLHWVVSNIQINDISHGDRLFSYKAPEPAEWGHVYRYVFLIYEQKQKLELTSWIFQTKFDIDEKTPLNDFVEACQLEDPIAGSFLVYKRLW